MPPAPTPEAHASARSLDRPLENANLIGVEPLPPPAELKARLPVPEAVAGAVLCARARIRSCSSGPEVGSVRRFVRTSISARTDARTIAVRSSLLLT